jgi:hypothetical protein
MGAGLTKSIRELSRQRKERAEIAGDKDDIDAVALGALEIAAVWCSDLRWLDGGAALISRRIEAVTRRTWSDSDPELVTAIAPVDMDAT